MNFCSYLQEVKGLPRSARITNLIQLLNREFACNKTKIIEFLNTQESQIQLPQDLLQYFMQENIQQDLSTLKASDALSFSQQTSATWNLYNSNSTKSQRAFSSIYSQGSQNISQRPTHNSQRTNHVRSNTLSSVKKYQLTTTSPLRNEFQGMSNQKNQQLDQDQILQIALDKIKTGKVKSAMNDLLGLQQQENTSQEFQVSLTSTLFQCSRIMGDKQSCDFYSQQYHDQRQFQTWKQSPLQIDMLLHQIKKILKLNDQNQIQSCHILVEELQTLNESQLSRAQNAKKIVYLLKYYMITFGDYEDYINTLYEIGQNDLKLTKTLFAKLGKLTFKIQFQCARKELFLHIYSHLNSSSIFAEDAFQISILQFLKTYIEQVIKDYNISYIKIATNKYLEWCKSNTCSLSALSIISDISEKLVNVLLQKYSHYDSYELDNSLNKIFSVLRDLHKCDDIVKKIFQLSLQVGKFYYSFQNVSQALDYFKQSYYFESFSKTKEGSLLKFKLLSNILQIGLKSKDFDDIHYIYEVDKLLNVQYFDDQDRAILCNEIGNLLSKGKLYRSAQTYYQRALTILPQQHEASALIKKNLFICLSKITTTT